jgi:hypothetical protein
MINSFMSKFKNLSIDYSEILRRASVSNRVAIAKSEFAQDILNRLPPSELARLFPKYYRDKIPAISKAYYGDFTSQSYSGGSYSTATPSQSISVPSSTTTTQTTQQSTTKKSDDKSKPAWFNKIMEGSSTNDIPSAKLEKQSRGLAYLRQKRFGKIDEQTLMAIAAMGKTEVGGMTPRTKQQWLETVINRAYIQNRSLQGFTKKTKGSYWQSSGKKVSKEDIAEWRGYLNNVMAGSNITNGMTDNASNDYRRGNELANKRYASGREGYWSEGTTGDFEKDKDKGEFLYNDFRFKKGRQAMLDEAKAYEKNNPSAILKQPNDTGKINPDTTTPKPTDSSRVVEKQAKKAGTRKLPVSPKLKKVLDYAAAQNGVEVEVWSGGQAKKGTKGPRTGSTRHDLGNAADVDLYVNENGERRKLLFTNPKDLQIIKNFTKDAVRAGATGVGAGRDPSNKKDDYMGDGRVHIGFDKWDNPEGPLAWGEGGSPKTAPKWLQEALQEGLESPVDISKWNGAEHVSAPDRSSIQNRGMTFGHPTAVPALPDNIPENVRNEIAKLSAEDQEAIRQKLEELGPTGIETITRAIEESPSPKAAEAAVEAVQSATPAQVQKIISGDLEGFEIPTVGKPKWNQGRGDPRSQTNDIVSINTAFGKANVNKKAAVAFKGFYADLKSAGAPINSLGSHVIRKKRSAGAGHNPGGGWSQHSYGYATDIDNAAQLSPAMKKWIQDNPGVLEKYKRKWGMLTPRNDEPHMEFGGHISQEAYDQLIKEQKEMENIAKADPTAIIPQQNQTGDILPKTNELENVPIENVPLYNRGLVTASGHKSPIEAPEKAVQAVPETVLTPTVPQVTAPVAPQQPTPTAVPVEPPKTTGKAVGRAAGESPTKITPKIDVKPTQSVPDVPMMKTGGEVQASGEDFSIVDNNSKRKLGEVSRGENIKFNTKGRVEVTPDQRIDPRALEAAQEVRQEHHERVVENNKQEMPQATMMQGARVPEKAPTQFTSYEQWGRTETPASYVRAMAQAKGRKHDGSFPGSRFGEEQLSAI